jgi:hypothetical protein
LWPLLDYPCEEHQRGTHWQLEREGVLELIIVVLIVLWLLGYFGPVRIPAIPQSGNLIHLLLIIALILVIVRLLR